MVPIKMAQLSAPSQANALIAHPAPFEYAPFNMEKCFSSYRVVADVFLVFISPSHLDAITFLLEKIYPKP